MKRLTEKQSSGFDLKEMNGEWCNKYCEQQRVETCNECVIYHSIQKLAEYEDLEELIGIPLKDLAKISRQNIPEDCKHPRKAIVLTDDDVDRWNGYKNAEEQALARLHEFIEENSIDCVEDVYQRDSVNEECVGLVAELIEIIIG